MEAHQNHSENANYQQKPKIYFILKNSIIFMQILSNNQ